MSTLIQAMGGVQITVNAGDKLATFSNSTYSITTLVGYPNVPAQDNVIFNGSGANLTAAFSAATTVIIQAGVSVLYYQTGTAPVIPERSNLQNNYAVAPGTLNATGTLTAALILGSIVTSSTAAAVTATLDTGTAMDAAQLQTVDTGFMWSAINTGGSNAFTVTASSGHTIVGSGAVAANSSGRFLTRRTAATTWVTYRIS